MTNRATQYYPEGDVVTCASCGKKWWIAKKRYDHALPFYPDQHAGYGFMCGLPWETVGTPRSQGCGARLPWEPLLVVGHRGDDPAVLRLIEEVVRRHGWPSKGDSTGGGR